MGIGFDGINKLIVLTTQTIWDFRTDIYEPLQGWAAQPENMQYLLPCQGTGHAALGSGLYTDSIYVLINGWKLTASGYVIGQNLTVQGTLITSDSSSIVSLGSELVIWTFQVATQGIVVTTGSGLSSLEHDTLVNTLPGLVSGQCYINPAGSEVRLYTKTGALYVTMNQTIDGLGNVIWTPTFA